MLRARRDSRRRRRRPGLALLLLLLGLLAAAPSARAEDATLADAWAYWEERPYLAIDARLLVAVGAPGDRVYQDSLIATIRAQRAMTAPDESVRAAEQATLDRMTAEALGIASDGWGAGLLAWLGPAAVVAAAGGALVWRRRRSRPAMAPARPAPARRERPPDPPRAEASVRREAAASPTAPRVERERPAAPAEPARAAPRAERAPAPAADDGLGLLGDTGLPAGPGAPSGADVDEHALELAPADEDAAPALGEPGAAFQLDTTFDGELVPPEGLHEDGAAARAEAEAPEPPRDAPWILEDTATRLPPVPESAAGPGESARPEPPPVADLDLLALDLAEAAPSLPRFTKLEVKEAAPRELREHELALGFPDGRLARLALAKIEAIALVEIAGGDGGALLLDLALDWRAVTEGGALRVVRLRSPARGPAADALRLLAEELAARSGAAVLTPGSDGAPPRFDDADRYARDVLLVAT